MKWCSCQCSLGAEPDIWQRNVYSAHVILSQRFRFTDVIHAPTLHWRLNNEITDVRTTAVSITFKKSEIWYMGRWLGVSNVIVQVETDTGLVGLGESVGSPSCNVVNRIIDSWRDSLLDQDPLRIEALMDRVVAQGGWQEFDRTGNVARAGRGNRPVGPGLQGSMSPAICAVRRPRLGEDVLHVFPPARADQGDDCAGNAGGPGGLGDDLCQGGTGHRGGD